MGKTIIEKIIENKSNQTVKPKDTVLLELDVRSARDFGGANVVKNFEREYPNETVNDKAKTFFTFDCVVPANNVGYANNQQTIRLFANKHNIPLFDVDAGIGSHVMIEKELALPGKTIVGTDSHLNILGAIGAFGQGMGDTDIAFSFKTGKTWFEVPESIKLNINGKLAYPANAKDLTLAIVKHFGANGALGKVVEIYGELIDRLTLSDRITLASMATECGAITFIIPPNNLILNYFQNTTNESLSPIYADDDANYSETIQLDLGTIEPMISLPGHPEDVVPVKDVTGKPIDSVFIGSCTNGRFEDYLAGEELLGEKRIDPKVMAKIVPATKEVFGKLLSTGLMAKYHSAGFIVSNQGCGGCASGQIGMTGEGEVQLSTSNRNFKGKQGAGSTYICSPTTAVASAINGKITDPRSITK
jgi:3-isopropylmalate/(R)-2-methylmalate dehydratase large subunit